MDEAGYAEIIKRFADPDGDFLKQFRNTLRRYRPSLTDDRISDLFQDSFIAARKNLIEGRIKENTSWNSYLISIGLNLATHEFRRFGRFVSIDGTVAPDDSDRNSDGVLERLKGVSEEELAEYNSPEVQKVFAETLEFMNDNCKKILKLSWEDGLSHEQIAIEMNSTAKSIKVRKSRCKQMFVKLITASLRSLGYEVDD